MTTEQYMQWLRAHRFVPFCPHCKRPVYNKDGSYRCRSFAHFGIRGYDYENERTVWAHELGERA